MSPQPWRQHPPNHPAAPEPPPPPKKRTASETKKYILCIDCYNDSSDPPLIGARILDADNLKEIGQAGVGAWESERDAVVRVVLNAFSDPF